MIQSGDDLDRLVRRVFGDEPPPKPLNLLKAIRLIRAGRSIREAATEGRTTPSRLSQLMSASDPILAILGGEAPALVDTVEKAVRQSLGQLVIGNVAERVFEEIYKTTLGTSELELKDDRGARGETDYLVFNGHARQVFRINIKFHGSLFRRAKDLVGLDPEDCFALATYKIHAALNRQNAEHLPYIFVIVGVAGLTGAVVGATVPEDLVHLAALPRLSKKITGLRQVEDKIVEALTGAPLTYGFEADLRESIKRVRDARWFVLSARRADNLLREWLFERAYALRVRAFARNYAGAELDMHFSLSQDLRPLAEFLEVLRNHGMPGLVTRLERGTL